MLCKSENYQQEFSSEYWNMYFPSELKLLFTLRISAVEIDCATSSLSNAKICYTITNPKFPY